MIAVYECAQQDTLVSTTLTGVLGGSIHSFNSNDHEDALRGGRYQRRFLGLSR